MMEAENLKNLPTELKYNARWCCWRYRKEGDGRLTKEPFDAKTGHHAKSNDKATFCTYPELLNAYGTYDGIGIGLFDGYSAIDIDHCISDTGDVSPMAKDIIDQCSSYTERSPSGKGIRIIIKVPKGFSYDKQRYYIKNSEKGLEIYVEGFTSRFVTMTGDTLGISDKVATVNLRPILERYMKRDDSWSAILRKDRKLSELWNGTAPGSGQNESELDLALLSKIAYYMQGDKERTRACFEASPYYKSKDEAHKAKWEQREDYKAATLNKACDGLLPSGGPWDAVGIDSENPPAAKLGNILDGTDTGNALKFAAMFKDSVRYNCDNRGWMIWNGKYWEFDYTNRIRNYVEILAERLRTEMMPIEDEEARKKCVANIKHILNKAGKDALLTEAAAMGDMPTVNSDYNKDSELLNCENGVVNLRTGELLPHDKGQMISQSTHIDVDLEGEPKEFLRFLDSTFDGNKGIIDFLLKAFAYSMTNEAGEQEMYILYGDGSNGKSLLLEVIHDILGDYATMSRPTLLTEQFNGNSSLGAIARLQGKRFVCCEELKTGDRMDESIIKMLTSGYGNIIGKFLYANEFEFNFKGKIFMATNYKPVIRGTDKGIWRRINVIPFRKAFEGKDADKTLKEKLMAEKSQILGYLAKCYRRYLKEGLEPPADMTKEVMDYRTEQDVVQNWVDERCQLGPREYAKASALYTDFVAWAKANNEFVMSNTMFGRNLAKKFERKQLSSGKVYYGIAIRRDAPNIERDVAFDRIKVRDDI